MLEDSKGKITRIVYFFLEFQEEKKMIRHILLVSVVPKHVVEAFSRELEAGT